MSGGDGERKENEKKEHQRRTRNEALHAFGLLTQVGLTMFICVLLGVLLGRALDGWLGTSPWLLILFSFIGGAAAIRSLFEFVKK